MNTNRIPKQALQYRPKGRRNIGWPRKRWSDQLHLEDQGTGNTPNPSWTSWWWWKSKGKVFSLRAIKTYRGRRGIAPPFLNLGAYSNIIRNLCQYYRPFKKIYGKISYPVITRLRDGLSAVRFPARTSGFSPRCPDPTLLLNRHGSSLPGYKAGEGLKLTNYLQLLPRLWINGEAHPLPLHALKA